MSNVVKSLERIPIVISFTESYLVPAAVVIKSILDHLSIGAPVQFICLLSEELGKYREDKLRRLGNGATEFAFHIVDSSLLADVNINGRYGLAAYYRIFLPNILAQYEKVIYIDCDIVVRNDLAHLYNTTKLADNYLAAIFEPILPFQRKHLQEIGCQADRYFNSGFLIMNLNKMREDKISRKLLRVLENKLLEFPDQDALNIVCSGQTVGLPPFYNSIRSFWLPQYKSVFLNLYTESDWKSVHKHGNVHYTGSKPWNSFTVEFDVWWDYFDRLPKELKQSFALEKKWHLLSKFYRTLFGKFLIESARNFSRYLRKNGG